MPSVLKSPDAETCQRPAAQGESGATPSSLIDLREVGVLVEGFHVSHMVPVFATRGDANLHSGLDLVGLADLAVASHGRIVRQHVGMFLPLWSRHHQFVILDADKLAVMRAGKRGLLDDGFDVRRHVLVAVFRRDANLRTGLQIGQLAGIAITSDLRVGGKRMGMLLPSLGSHYERHLLRADKLAIVRDFLGSPRG